MWRVEDHQLALCTQPDCPSSAEGDYNSACCRGLTNASDSSPGKNTAVSSLSSHFQLWVLVPIPFVIPEQPFVNCSGYLYREMKLGKSLISFKLRPMKFARRDTLARKPQGAFWLSVLGSSITVTLSALAQGPHNCVEKFLPSQHLWILSPAHPMFTTKRVLWPLQHAVTNPWARAKAGRLRICFSFLLPFFFFSYMHEVSSILLKWVENFQVAFTCPSSNPDVE